MKRTVFLKMVFIMLMIILNNVEVVAQTQKSYTYGCSVEFDVTHNGKTGLLAHINAKVNGRKGHRIQIGVIFSNLDEEGNPSFAGGRNEILDATSDTQVFTDVQIFLPYEDYMLNAIGQYVLFDIDTGEFIYMDMDPDHMFGVDQSKLQRHSNYNKNVNILQAEKYCMFQNGKWGEWQPSNVAIINDAANNKFVFLLKEKIELQITNAEELATDNEGTKHVVFYTVDQHGLKVKVEVDLYTDGRKFMIIYYDDFAVMYKIKN